MPATLTVREAAKRAGVSRQNIEYWMRKFPQIVADAEVRPKVLHAGMIDKITDARSVLGRLSTTT